MKRFLWLPAAVTGVGLMTVLMWACMFAYTRAFPVPFVIPKFTKVVPIILLRYGVFGASLGVCSVMLWSSKGSLLWRALSVTCGLSVLIYGLWNMRRVLQISNFSTFGTKIIFVSIAFYAPLLLWGLGLLLVAVLTRSPSREARQTEAI